ncbi:MAG TPA: 30S ribosomal protein S12 methylthiotransferase RimO, partial [Papillibacter sp.]|nr:30S ribosomal protein S12 methylthiotransferase RimO [Papillibacter sp.]
MRNKVGLISLGCAKNLVNSEQMLYLLQEAGYDVQGDSTEDISRADAVVINTCGFIESAKMEAIETILEIAEEKKAGNVRAIVVAGCLAERYKDELLREMPEIDAVVGVGSFADIVDAVTAALKGRAFARFGDNNLPDPETDRIITTPKGTAYVKIAEGCDNRCAYCAIPDIRGRFRSRSMESVLAEAERLAQRGVKELIVVAQDTTRYGLDLYGRRRLAELLEKLCQIEGVKWIRLHYLYPDEIDDALIHVIAREEKIVKYLDIPIQHISDKILKAMRRRGTKREIETLFRKIREQISGVVLRTSLITGLPGEGEGEFEELCAFLREAEIERAGVFPYSPEEGTPAAGMEHPPFDVAQRRAELI